MVSIKALPLVAISSTTLATSRPAAFYEHYIASRAVPYRFVESRLRPSSSGGVLPVGQAVWLEQVIRRTMLSPNVRAYVENLGFVSLDPRLIKKGDGSVSFLK
jgi:hypothetical protein